MSGTGPCCRQDCGLIAGGILPLRQGLCKRLEWYPGRGRIALPPAGLCPARARGIGDPRCGEGQKKRAARRRPGAVGGCGSTGQGYQSNRQKIAIRSAGAIPRNASSRWQDRLDRLAGAGAFLHVHGIWLPLFDRRLSEMHTVCQTRSAVVGTAGLRAVSPAKRDFAKNSHRKWG